MVTPQQITDFKQKVEDWVRSQTQKHSIRRLRIADLYDLLADFTFGNSKPEPLMITWSEMIDNEEYGRVRYENILWKGFNPFLQLDNSVRLILNIDYVLLVDGGFELLQTGSVPVLYDGQLLWSCNYAKNDDELLPPFITNQPINKNVDMGDTLLLEINASNYTKVQWYFNGELIDGQNGLTLSIENFTGSNEGSYYAILSNPNYIIQSSTINAILQ